MADFLKDKVKYQDRDIEVIRVIFALAFNLNILACLDAVVEAEKKTSFSAKEVPYYRMNLGFKTYFLMIDAQLNIAGADSSDPSKSSPSDFNPVSNQIKIAFFLINNNLVPNIIKDNLEII